MVKNLNADLDDCNFSAQWPDWALSLLEECHKLSAIEENKSISIFYKKYYKWIVFRKATRRLHC